MSTAVLSTPSPNSKMVVGNSFSSYHTPMSYKCQNLSNSSLFMTPLSSFKTSTPIAATHSQNNNKTSPTTATSTSKYVNLGTIGEGSYGLVLKCKDRETGRLVAIKKFIESEDDKSVRKIAMREIHLLKQLRHENLVNLLEVFRRKRRLYLVFEFVDRSLLDHLELSPNGLEKGQIRRILFQVIRALEFCHIHNIIHRDVKPENILISKNGVVKLCDFGFARTLAKPGEIYTEYVSTRWYRAPELLVGDSRYGRAVDIWALGCLNAEMLTGQPLFPGDSDIDQLFSIVKCFGGLCRRHEDKLYNNPSFRFEISQIEVTEPLKCRLRGCTARDFQFVSMCLELDPQDRPTCSSLLQHPLFTCDGFSSWFPEELAVMIRKDEEGDKRQLAKPRRLLPDLSKCLELSKPDESVLFHHNGSTVSLDASFEKSFTNLNLSNICTTTAASTSNINNGVNNNNQSSSNLGNASIYKSTTNGNLNAKESIKGFAFANSKGKFNPLNPKHSGLNNVSANGSGFDCSLESTCTSIVEASPQVPVAKKLEKKTVKANDGAIKNGVKCAVQSPSSSSSSSNPSSAEASTSSMTSSSASSCYAKNENFVGKKPGGGFGSKNSSNHGTSTAANNSNNSSSLKKNSSKPVQKNGNCQNSIPTSKPVHSLQPKNVLLPSQQRLPQQRSGESPKDSRKPVGTTTLASQHKQQQNVQPKMTKKSQVNNADQQHSVVAKNFNVVPGRSPQYGYPKPVPCNKNFMTAVKFST